MTDIVLGIRLKADGSDLVGEVKVSEEALKKLREETGRNTYEAARLNAEQQNMAKTLNQSSGEAQKFVDSLKREADTLGFTTVQMRAYTASQMEFTDAQALSVAQSLKAMQAHEQEAAAVRAGTAAKAASASAIGAYTALWQEVAGVVLKAANAVKDYIKDSALLAARHETLGIVMGVVGRNAGVSATEMNNYAEAVRKSGITMNESRETVIKLAQAQIDLSLASKLARAAQDAAVIANTNSSEALDRMIHGIVSGQTEVLRTMGINVSFEDGYKKLAKTLGITTEQLAEHEKVQSRSNQVLEYSVRLQGTYEAAMSTAGKQMNSLQRYTEDLKTMRGEVWNEALVIGVEAYTNSLKDATKQTQTLQSDGSLKEWGKDIVHYAAVVGDALMAVWKLFQTSVEEGSALVLRAAARGAQAARYMVGGPLLAPFLPKTEIENYSDDYSATVRGRTTARLDPMHLSILQDAERRRNAAKAEAEDPWLKEADDQYNAQMGKSLAAQARAKSIADARASGGKSAAAEDNTLVKWLQDAENELQKLTEGELPEFDKWLRQVISSGKEFSDEQLAGIAAMKGEIDMLRDANAELKLRREELDRNAKAQAEADAITAKWNARVLADGEAIASSIEQLQFQTSLIGKNTAERERAIAVRNLEAKAATQSDSAMQQNRERLDLALAANEAARAADEAQKKSLTEFNGLWSTVERTGKDVFTHIFDNGDSTFKNLGKSLKASLIDMLYQLTLRKWIISIGANITDAAGLTTGAAAKAAAAGGGLGGLGNLLSFGKSAWDAAGGSSFLDALGITSTPAVSGLSYFGAAEAAGMLGSGVASTALSPALLGGTLPSYSAFTTAGMWAPEAAISGTAGYTTAAGGAVAEGLTASAAAEGVAAGTAAASAAGAGIGATIAAAVPYVGLALAAYSLLSGGGGGGPAHGTGADVTATITPEGIANAVWMGHAANSKQSFTFTAHDHGSTEYLNQSIQALFASMDKGAKLLGLDASKLNHDYSFFAAFTPSGPLEVAAQLTQSLSQVSDQMAQELIPNIKSMQQANESLTQTFLRLVAAAQQAKLNDIVGLMGGAIQLQDQTKDLWLSDLSPLTNAQRLAQSSSLYKDALTAAQGGDLKSLNSLSGLSHGYLAEARNYYASSPDYTSIFNQVQTDVTSLVNDTLTEQSIQFAEMGLTLKDIAANTKDLDSRIASALQNAIDTWQAAQLAAQKAAADQISEAVTTAAETTTFTFQSAYSASFVDWTIAEGE